LFGSKTYICSEPPSARYWQTKPITDRNYNVTWKALLTLPTAFSLADHEFIWTWPLIGFCQMLNGVLLCNINILIKTYFNLIAQQETRILISIVQLKRFNIAHVHSNVVTSSLSVLLCIYMTISSCFALGLRVVIVSLLHVPDSVLVFIYIHNSSSFKLWLWAPVVSSFQQNTRKWSCIYIVEQTEMMYLII
jgi:hypothetical protein